MPAGARQLHYSYEEYLALEEKGATRHEYWHGEIYAMAGGTPDHAALAASLLGLLHPQLPATCRAFSSDLRVHVEATDLTTYPDVTVVCGKSERADKDRLAVTNPCLLAEITSPATEDYDRGEKLRHFQTIASVVEILIVSHREPRVTVYRRDGEGAWSSEEAVAGQSVLLGSLGATLDVSALYAAGLEDS